MYGHLEVARWLASRFNLTSDDAHAIDIDAIRRSLVYHKDLLQWLANHFNITI